MSDEQEGGFGMMEPFDVDNGELDGLTPQQCFVLGYECRMVHEMLEDQREIEDQPVHAANRERLMRMAIRRGAPIHITKDTDEDGWCHMTLGKGADDA